MADYNVRDFVREHRIKIRCGERGSNPYIPEGSRWGRDATHWHCTLSMGSKRLTTYFSQGSAHTEEPTAEDVLGSLALDASGYDNARDFRDWARELGMEWEPECERMSQARAENYGIDCAAYFEAKDTYKVVGQLRAKLHAFLGSALYRELLYETESL